MRQDLVEKIQKLAAANRELSLSLTKARNSSKKYKQLYDNDRSLLENINTWIKTYKLAAEHEPMNFFGPPGNDL